ncbi:ribonuclease III domain-containing protein [Leptodontidium sp. 2 PMI_412]|nr:ribonuclease III domain-containing protein [Leptodontidium sp. 2 PMI_412]
MQSLFNRHKRKHDEGAGLEEHNKKHKRYSGHHADESRISKSMERARIDPRPSVSSSVTPAQSRKIANLIKALDEALEEDGMDQTLDFIGDEALNRCLDLRTSLRSARAKLDDGATRSSFPSREQKSHDFFNVPKTFSPYSLEPWKSSTIPTTLPPLPKVFNLTLEKSAFTHIGCGSGRPTDLSYERLEWIGDAYIELISTLLISQTFPFLLPGKQSQIRERLVKNITLAEFSRQYGFDKRLVLPDPKIFSVKPPDMTKILGDVFEAYVAAVILSDPPNGVARVSQWLKDIWGMILAKDIIHEERTGFNLESPIWNLRGTQPVEEDVSKVEKQPLNAKERLQHLIGSKGVRLSYNEAAPVNKDPSNKLPLFTMGVYLDGYGEKAKMLGTGQGNGKRDAGYKAAETAMANKKLMKVYVDKKKLVDAQLQLEQEALDDQQNA